MNLNFSKNDPLNPEYLERTKEIRKCISQRVDKNPFEYYKELLIYFNRLDDMVSVKLMLDDGADIASLKWTRLLKSIVFTPIKEMKKSFKIEEIEQRDSFKRTPFLFAVIISDIEKVKFLVKNGADIYVKARYCSALMYAVQNNDTKMLSYLVDLGLDINAHNSDYMGTALHLACDLGYLESVQTLLSLGAKIEYSYILESSIEEDEEVYSVTNKAIYKVSIDKKIVDILIQAGADIKDISGSMRDKLLGLNSQIAIMVTREDYHRDKSIIRGKSNPELITTPFHIYMLHSNKTAYNIEKKYEEKSKTISFEKPIWCAERYGRSMNILDDGRIIEIGGEHEDFYSPEFCIYNDITVFYPDKKIEVYTYPKEIFAPTDGHTATLVGENIYIIGNIGYLEERKYGFTPVYKLNLKDYSIQELKTSGEMAGWIHEHNAKYDGISSIEIRGGKIDYEENKEFKINHEAFRLDLKGLEWKKE